MRGFVDLHCHYVPAIDDGAKTFEQGVAILQGLKRIGYDTVIATPHIRTAMFENRGPGLRAGFDAFAAKTKTLPGIPKLGLGAEHFFDDIVWELLYSGEGVPYPGGHAALIEFTPQSVPRNIEQRFFDLKVKGIHPVIAHPERYTEMWKGTDAIERLLGAGGLPQLDVMSLVGKYGRKPKKAAERMLKNEYYFMACSDTHKPDDVPIVEKAIKRLRKLAGDEYAQELLSDNPRSVLEGDLDDL